MYMYMYLGSSIKKKTVIILQMYPLRNVHRWSWYCELQALIRNTKANVPPDTHIREHTHNLRTVRRYMYN